VWPFLLEVFDPASHYQQRQAQHQLMLRQYQQLLLQCQVGLSALFAGVMQFKCCLAAVGCVLGHVSSRGWNNWLLLLQLQAQGSPGGMWGFIAISFYGLQASGIGFQRV
jgi:hypothetical protein